MKTKLKTEWFPKHFLTLATLILAVAVARAADPSAASGPADAAGNFTGRVLETMTTGGYTYVQVDTGSQKIWATTTAFVVNKGDRVTVFDGMPMANFHSQSLNRDFDVVYFSGKISNNSAAATGAQVAPVLPPGHPPLTGQASPVLPAGHPALAEPAAPMMKVDLTGIKKATGGKTVEEIFAAKASLAGKPVAVRGKVVKYNAMVMGKNWLHVQDGSGSATKGNNDLTVTTDTAAQVGDTVLVNGKVSADKDFGAGYKYSVILDNATVTVE
jgi:hypothetical protein